LLALLTEEVSSWRFAFQIVGAIGILWIVLWFAFVRRQDLARPPASSRGSWSVLGRVFIGRRMLTIFAIVILINTAWQLLRAWLPKFLHEGRGYTETYTLSFNSLFYLATDVGCISAGAFTLWLHRRGFSIHGARRAVFGTCATLTALLAVAAYLPAGWLLLSLLLVAGAGALGLFPIYYSLTQDISSEHQGKVSGIASVAAWTFASPTHKYFGRLVDSSKSFDLGLAIAGLLPLLAFAVLCIGWGKTSVQDIPRAVKH
jgi:cyanate permease